MHEAQMHEKNSFITLTYSDEHLASPKLQYLDFQLFAKRLRSKIFRDFVATYGKAAWSLLEKSERKELLKKIEISIFVTGEYGDERKRPHWHALVFNWRPQDAKPLYENHRGDRVFDSELLTQLWGKGRADLGSVTFESAGYVARYAAKKLAHGSDGHPFEPISKKSSRLAIGKKWLEKYWPDVFNFGITVMPDGRPIGSIPRYYEKWLKTHQPEAWRQYVTETKQEKMDAAQSRATREQTEQIETNDLRRIKKGLRYTPQRTQNQARQEILKQKFKKLQNYLKL